MNKILTFYCGFCKNPIAMTRKGLRLHLREHIRNNLFNGGLRNQPDCRKDKVKQEWVIIK